MLAVVPCIRRPMPPAPGEVIVESLFHTHRDSVARYLRPRFPRVCASSIDDAVSEAFVDLLRQKDDVEHAYETGGVDRVAGLLRVVAWRKLRGQRRRAHVRAEVGVEDLGVLRRSNPAGQDLGVALQRFEQAVDRAVPHANTRASLLPAVREALLDKLETHDSDGIVAARHGIRREHLNRAKRALMAELDGLV
jgi:hypothetical protein